MERKISQTNSKIREADPERAIVYTDETWLNQEHRTKKEWVDLETLKEKT